MKSSMHLVGSIVWLVTALGCVQHGLLALGYDPFTMMGMAHWAKYVLIIYGIAGVISLLMFFMSGGNCCGSCSCDTSGRGSHH